MTNLYEHNWQNRSNDNHMHITDITRPGDAYRPRSRRVVGMDEDGLIISSIE